MENDETTEEIEKLDNKYYEFSFNNIKKTLDIIGVNKSSKIIVYSQLEDYKILLVNNEIEKISEDLFKGNCTYENCLKLIKNTTCKPEENYKKYFSCSILPTLKDGGYQDLYYFPELKLYFYIYDQRGGIIISEDYNQEKMKIIFENVYDVMLIQKKENQGDKDSLITLFKEGKYHVFTIIIG